MGPIRTTHRLAWVALAMAVAACDRRDRSAPAVDAEAVWAAFRESDMHAAIRIRYPLDETVFPPEIVAPTVRWEDPSPDADAWVISVGWGQAGSTSGQGLRSGSTDPSSPALAALSSDADEGEGGRKRGQGELSGSQRLRFAVREQIWRPEERVWEAIKERSAGRMATVWILGVRAGSPARVVSAGRVRWETSRDAVGAAIFYREVNLPFIEAVKDPSRIRWRWGEVSSAGPPVVLEGLPVCGNCHSFTRDGQWLAMDVDYANSKGSYVITRTAEEMVLATSEIITWNDYRPEDNEQTFGLLSQISPDGRAVISTVKDKSVFVPRDGLAYSQLFFPIKGILAFYDRSSSSFASLSGADDPAFVQSNPAWSPDGKTVLFARATAHPMPQAEADDRVVLPRYLAADFIEGRRGFKFDVYKIPWNQGKGGVAVPLRGASNNGMSNYFARATPDGKWVVFVQAANFMLLQPDSQLYIVPFEGGSARRMTCNTPAMNSWHSFSPNGRWMVFASKARGAFTQLWLTHLDDSGQDTPAVLLEHLSTPERAANIPEFVKLAGGGLHELVDKFSDGGNYHYRVGKNLVRYGELARALGELDRALLAQPNDLEALLERGVLHFRMQHTELAVHDFVRASSTFPADFRGPYNLGLAWEALGELAGARRALAEAASRSPRRVEVWRKLVELEVRSRDRDGALHHLNRAMAHHPSDPGLRSFEREIAAMAAPQAERSEMP